MLILSASKSLESHGACHGARGQCSAPELMWDIYIYKYNTTESNSCENHNNSVGSSVFHVFGLVHDPFSKIPSNPNVESPITQDVMAPIGHVDTREDG